MTDVGESCLCVALLGFIKTATQATRGAICLSNPSSFAPRAAKVSVMAGFVGDDRQWRKFEKRSGKLFKRYRIDIFHAVDVCASVSATLARPQEKAASDGAE